MGLPAALTVIGEVRTGYASTEGTPIQAGLNRAERAVIEIAEPYLDGLGTGSPGSAMPGC